MTVIQKTSWHFWQNEDHCFGHAPPLLNFGFCSARHKTCSYRQDLTVIWRPRFLYVDLHLLSGELPQSELQTANTETSFRLDDVATGSLTTAVFRELTLYSRWFRFKLCQHLCALQAAPLDFFEDVNWITNLRKFAKNSCCFSSSVEARWRLWNLTTDGSTMVFYLPATAKTEK